MHDHVDCKIANTLLKKGTKQYIEGWDTSSKVWTHMVLHLSHPEIGFGITFNDVTVRTLLVVCVRYQVGSGVRVLLTFIDLKEKRKGSEVD
jgi:hypothetical protein